jgi:DNA-binding response OmpR family regulator
MENETKKKILVIEDDLPTQNALIDKLTKSNFEVLRAVDGEKGLAIAFDYHPGLILLDIMIPKIDGMEIMKRLRSEEPWGKNVPIFILSNLNPNEEKIMKSIVENEPSYYLVKANSNLDDIIEKIKEKFNN